MILGCHVSFSNEQVLGSAKDAVTYGANAFMFYTGAPQNTLRKELNPEYIKEFHSYIKTHGIEIEHIVCHAPYIINLANKNDLSKWQFSIQFLKNEILRCEMMGITKIVLHPGSAVGISKSEGLQNIIDALNLVIREDQTCQILLETMAGKGNECGSNLEEIKIILEGVHEKKLMGVCLDTCHLHDAGYDLADFDAFLDLFDQEIGLDLIGCIHINDSKNELGAHKDRHENIGFGKLGFQILHDICYSEKLKKVPKILETPFIGVDAEDKKRVYPPYRFEIQMIRNQIFDPSLYDHIRDYFSKEP